MKSPRLKRHPVTSMTRRILRFMQLANDDALPALPLPDAEAEKVKKLVENAIYIAETQQEEKRIYFNVSSQRWVITSDVGLFLQRPGIYVREDGGHHADGDYYYRVWRQLYTETQPK